MEPLPGGSGNDRPPPGSRTMFGTNLLTDCLSVGEASLALHLSLPGFERHYSSDSFNPSLVIDADSRGKVFLSSTVQSDKLNSHGRFVEDCRHGELWHMFTFFEADASGY